MTLDTQFYHGIVTSSWAISKEVSLDVTADGGWDQYKQPSSDFDVTVRKVETRPSLTYRPFRDLSFTVGTEYFLRKASGVVTRAALPTYDGTSQSSTPVALAQGMTHSLAAYVSADWTIGARVQLVPTLRVANHSQTDETLGDPRMLARVFLVKHAPGVESLALKAAVRVYNQLPSLLQTDTAVGNPDLDAEESTNYMGGIEYRPHKSLLVEVDGFYMAEHGVFTRTSATTTRNGSVVPLVYDNGGGGSTKGLEVFAQQELWHHLDGWLFYIYSVADIAVSSGVSPTTSSYDQSHVFGAMLDSTLPHGWALHLRELYSTGYPTTGILSTTFNASTKAYTATAGMSLGDRTPAYQQLDLRVDKTWAFPTWAFTAYVDVRNVTNHKNVASINASNYDASQAYYRTSLPILPLLGARADF